jgi:prophage regulatory protein
MEYYIHRCPVECNFVHNNLYRTHMTKYISSTSHYLRLPQVLEIIPIGKSTWWAGVKSGRYPKSVKLGPRITAWKTDDINQLMVTLENGSDE